MTVISLVTSRENDLGLREPDFTLHIYILKYFDNRHLPTKSLKVTTTACSTTCSEDTSPWNKQQVHHLVESALLTLSFRSLSGIFTSRGITVMTSVAAALISKRRKMDETGKRSGVTVNFGDQPVPLRDDGMEDEDAFFDAARSPESSEINGKGNNNKENSESENDDDKKEPAKKRTKKIRFSLSSDAGSTQGRGTAAAKAKNAARKLISNGGRVSLDPSEISGVTTAPPSAEKSVENVREDDVVEEEVAVGKHGLGGSPVDGFAVADDNDDDGFPITQDDDDDEDLVPPPPPEAEPTEEEEAFPAPDDDDDNEGPGFDMADNDVSGVDGSPVQSNKKSSKKKKKTRDDSTDEDSEDSMPVKKDKKQKKKRKKGQVSDGEEESVKTAPRKKAKKKKSRFATTFSPKGVPLPRQYKVVPISDLKCNSPEDPNLRRSRRHRYKPLEFWRGEVIEFGPTDEFDEDDFDSLQNMPVPKAIKMAEPTPYKPRKVIEREPTKGKKSKKTGGRSTAYVEQGESVEDKEFDSSKLRKKYTYNDGDEAYLWDDCVEESTELSKYLFIGSLYSCVGLDLTWLSCRLDFEFCRGSLLCRSVGGKGATPRKESLQV